MLIEVMVCFVLFVVIEVMVKILELGSFLLFVLVFRFLF